LTPVSWVPTSWRAQRMPKSSLAMGGVIVCAAEEALRKAMPTSGLSMNSLSTLGL
jgi:hypothetical protein